MNLHIVYLIAAFYIVFFLLEYVSVVEDKREGKLRSGETTHKVALMIIGITIVKLFIAAILRGFETDINCFTAWSQKIFGEGPMNFYSPDYFADYPPGYMLVLWVIGLLQSIFGFTMDGAKEFLLIDTPQYYLSLLKSPAIIADAIIAYFVFSQARAEFSYKTSRLIALIFLLNPLVILNSSVWGQIDSLLTLFLLLSLLKLKEERYILGAVFYAIALIIKPQALMLGPVYMCVYLGSKNWRAILGGIGTTLGIVLLSAIPFANQGFNFMWLIDKYISTLGSYNYVTINAYNIYAVFGLNWSEMVSVAWAVWGGIVIAAIVVGSVWFYIKAEGKAKILYMAYLLLTVMYNLMLKMHERYMFPALIFLLFAYLAERDRRLFRLFLFSTVTQFINTAIILAVYVTNNNHIGVAYGESVIIGLANFAIMIASLYYAYVIYVKGHVVKDARLEIKSKGPRVGVVKPLGEINGFFPSKEVAKMLRVDFIAMGAITLVYAAVAFYDLGAMTAPQTFYRTAEDNEEMVFDIGQEADIGKFMLYCGIGPLETVYDAQISSDGIEYRPMDTKHRDTEQGKVPRGAVFSWSTQPVEDRGRYIKLVTNLKEQDIGEVGIFAPDGTPFNLTVVTGQAALADEQDMLVDRPSYYNGSYFDEIYHPRTAYEIIHKMPVYETTHPPLGKVIMSLGVLMFGMVPFGWRFFGTLFGVMMLPVLYLILKRLFAKTWVASVGTTLFALDFMHFTLTRIGTIDSYAVLFILLMFYFVLGYARENFYETPVKDTYKHLILTGIAFGLGAASKWISIYGAFMIATVLILVWARRFREYFRNPKKYPEFNETMVKTLGMSVLSFIVIPLIIYCASYIPQMRYELDPARGVTASYYITTYQSHMYKYHADIKATHPFQSKWYEWTVIYKPLWAFIDYELKNSPAQPAMSSSISMLGNPAVWWLGVVTVLSVLFFAIRRKSWVAICIFAGYMAQLIMWIPVSRILFIYHYFACVPFLIMATMYVFNKLVERNAAYKYAVGTYLAVCLVLFCMFYPVMSGCVVPTDYIANWLRWMPTWYLY